MAGETRFEAVPEANFGSPEEHLRRAVQAIGSLQNGQGNNHHIVTLAPNASTTTIPSPTASVGSVPTLTPMSADAATSYAAGVVWATAYKGVITINHDSSSLTNRKFGVVLNG